MDGQTLYGSGDFDAGAAPFGTAEYVRLSDHSGAGAAESDGIPAAGGDFVPGFAQPGAAVVSVQRTAQNGRMRKYYEITSYGRRLLQDKTEEWRTYETAVNQVMGGVLFG